MRTHSNCLHPNAVMAILGVILSFPQPVRGGDPKEIIDLTADERDVILQITVEDVQSIVSFLSSDEMAGRQTPSPELKIASRFVATHFAAHHLQPLSKDDTFFQTHGFPVTQLPHKQPELSIGDQSLRSPGLLWAVKEKALTLESTVLSEADALAEDDPRCVLIDELVVPPQSVDNLASVLLTLHRRTRPLTNKGVQLVLMKCAADSPLRTVARRLANSPVPIRDGMTPRCAVVLVSAEADYKQKAIEAIIAGQQRQDVPVRNVVGIVRGSDPKLSQQAVLVSAHLDHIGTRSFGPDQINNGADDNATGVTAVILMAKAVAALKVKPRRSVIFATFWGEEKGLLGSKKFAEKPPWPLQDIVANVNMEMLGRPENDAREKSWMTGWKHSNLGMLMNAGSQRSGVEIFHRQDVSEMLYKRSDNYPFVQQGVIAHSFSAGSLHSDYHQPSDEWEKLDLPHMTKVIQGLTAGVLHVANVAERPAKADVEK